jgi:hypothetical protein
MKRETPKALLKSLRRHVLDDMAGHADLTCCYQDGEPDLSTMDPMSKPYWNKLKRLLRRIDRVLAEDH